MPAVVSRGTQRKWQIAGKAVKINETGFFKNDLIKNEIFP
ncbi:hypothetical protein BBD26_0899 [Lactobacillus delbrueckii subsp. bulgaricus]|nr:hypothetical protein BBD26_0899 [Lactobacillus delbrueckii subsp. bulgaricus]